MAPSPVLSPEPEDLDSLGIPALRGSTQHRALHCWAFQARAEFGWPRAYQELKCFLISLFFFLLPELPDEEACSRQAPGVTQPNMSTLLSPGNTPPGQTLPPGPPWLKYCRL